MRTRDAARVLAAQVPGGRDFAVAGSWPGRRPRSRRRAACRRRQRRGSRAPGVLGGLATLARRLADGQPFAPHQPLVLTGIRLIALVAGFALFTVLCGVLVMAFADAVTARRRQRELLALLAHGDPKVPGALVVDYPAAAAYCLPGIRSQIVVSVGTLDLLAPAELTAVLAHERAHLRARHDLVLIPFTSLRRALPQVPDDRPGLPHGRAAGRDDGRRPRAARPRPAGQGTGHRAAPVRHRGQPATRRPGRWPPRRAS